MTNLHYTSVRGDKLVLGKMLKTILKKARAGDIYINGHSEEVLNRGQYHEITLATDDIDFDEIHSIIEKKAEDNENLTFEFVSVYEDWNPDERIGYVSYKVKGQKIEYNDMKELSSDEYDKLCEETLDGINFT